jgi:hypothetical protein
VRRRRGGWKRIARPHRGSGVGWWFVCGGSLANGWCGGGGGVTLGDWWPPAPGFISPGKSSSQLPRAEAGRNCA